MMSALEAITERIREGTNLTKWFRRNACARHGVPWNETEDIGSVKVEVEHKHQHVGLDKERAAVEALAASIRADKTQPQSPTPGTSQPEETRFAKWAKAATVAAALGGLPAAGWGLAKYFTPPQQAETSAEGSLLQYLEDKGQHLPTGFSP
jgi:hypothetical protein